MPFEREPIFHDRQQIRVNGPINTTSNIFVDIPGAIFIAKDLGSPGNYQLWLSLSVQESNNNTLMNFRAIINGTPGDGRTVEFGPSSANNPVHATLIGQAVNVLAETIVKFQWSVSGGIGQINNFTTMLDGIPNIRVIN